VNETLSIVLFFVGMIVLQRWILPSMGVGT
jgi:hypothetical protein